MKKSKTQKGITLIALIITIVVLLILAVVAIRAVQGDGIIEYAKNASNDYETAQRNEEKQLLKYEYEIFKAEGKASGSYEEYVLEKIYNLKIGDKIEYDEGTENTTTPDITKGIGSSYNDNVLVTKKYTNENLEWRVLGINEAGQLEVISTKPTTETVTLYGKIGYINAKTRDGVRGTLDTFCYELYGKGRGADTARSLNSDDINKLANFNPETDVEYYNTEYTFKYDNSTSTVKMTADISKDLSEWIETGCSYYDGIDWTIDSENVGPQTLKYTYYPYSIADKIMTKIENDTILLSEIISCGEGNNGGKIIQWLTTYSVDCDNVRTCYGLRSTTDYRDCGAGSLYDFSCGVGYDNAASATVRPVVTLKSDIQIVDTDGNGIPNVK